MYQLQETQIMLLCLCCVFNVMPRHSESSSCGRRHRFCGCSTSAPAKCLSRCFLFRELLVTLYHLSPPSPFLPRQWRVRKEAMMGLASIYKKYSLQGEGGREASKQISWIKDKLLHIYYQNSIDDRFVFLVAALKNA